MNATILRQSKDAAALWAAQVLSDEDALILDTETTGLTKIDQVIELAVINMAGESLLDTRLRPTVPVDKRAQAVHGITLMSLRKAPRMSAIYEAFFALLASASQVIIFNKAFDIRMLNQTLAAFDCPLLGHVRGLRIECAMQWYAQWFGEWNERKNTFKWQKLPGAGHDAVGDCRATLNCLQMMAEGGAMIEQVLRPVRVDRGLLGPGMETTRTDLSPYPVGGWLEISDGA